ncbi:MAG: tol-pal system protein YbgF, partial [Rubrivivax sp.]
WRRAKIDSELRDLRARVTASEEASRARSADLLTRIEALAAAQASAQAAGQAAQVALNREASEALLALRRSLLDLNAQIENLRGDIARLRGEQEQLAREVADVQRRQRDVSQGIDDRLRRLEPVKVSLDGQEFLAEPDEKRQFEEALAVLRGGDFDRALGALGAFSRRYPGSGYTDAVRFWMGSALYGKREHREAIVAFRAFVTAAPRHPRAPEALLAVANSQAEMKDRPAARRTLEELLKSYPDSEAAGAGRERLAALR